MRRNPTVSDEPGLSWELERGARELRAYEAEEALEREFLERFEEREERWLERQISLFG